MSWRNTTESWGRVTILLHWLTALVVVGLFLLGLWMTSLTYYDPWYRKGPDLHRSIGVLLFIATAFRLLWRYISPPPAPLAEKRWEHIASVSMHVLLYLVLFSVMISGYLITTADGQSIDVFGWFAIPATLTGENQEDIAGTVHLILAWSLIGLAVLHALAALKHHFIDHDSTLKRMLGRS